MRRHRPAGHVYGVRFSTCSQRLKVLSHSFMPLSLSQVFELHQKMGVPACVAFGAGVVQTWRVSRARRVKLSRLGGRVEQRAGGV